MLICQFLEDRRLDRRGVTQGTSTPSQGGRSLWREVAAEYSIADAAGIALLTTACECLDRMRAAQAAIKEDGELVRDRYGALKLNPACGLEKDARAGFVLALKALNLDIEPLKDRVGRPGKGVGLTWEGMARAN